MDMELNLLSGAAAPDGPRRWDGVQDDPAHRTARAVNARTTWRPASPTVRNLGLMVKTGGYRSTSPCKGCRPGLARRPRSIRPVSRRSPSYGGHLDFPPSSAAGPGVMPLSVAEGIANGVPDVIACVRYPDSARRQADQGVRLGRG